MVLRALIGFLLCLAAPVWANDKQVLLHAPTALVETGLMKHILPRFSLKTQVRVSLSDDPNAADLRFGEAGTALFQGQGTTWRVEVMRPDHAGTKRFVDWLKSDIGQRTIAAYAPDGEALFGPPAAEARKVVEIAVDGDAEQGHKVSRSKCTRCHAVDDATKGWGIGSTPSFAVLRALPDWEERFTAFYALNPHPSFTQVIEVTEPFPIDRPSPIAPIELTLEELEALMAYVTAMAPANLGKPLEHQ